MTNRRRDPTTGRFLKKTPPVPPELQRAIEAVLAATAHRPVVIDDWSRIPLCLTGWQSTRYGPKPPAWKVTRKEDDEATR